MSKKKRQSGDSASPPGKTPFICVNCQGVLELPDDLNAVAAVCGFCGKEKLLPEHIIKPRQQQANRERQANNSREKAKRAALKKEQNRKRSIRGKIIAWSIILTTIGGIALAVYLNRDTRSTDPGWTGYTTVNQWLASLKAQGCDTVVTSTDIYEERTEVTMTMHKKGNCLNMIAATGIQTNYLNISMTNPFGQQLPSPQSNYFVNMVHCPEAEGDHQVVITPTTDDWFAFAAIDCPRSNYFGPRPTDDKSTGAAAVAARMKQLYKQGCTHIVDEAQRYDSQITFTPDMAKSKTANCLHMVAATGIQGNTLTMTMTTPFGENVAVPPPGNFIDFLFCGETGGKHPVTITPAANEYFTFAAIDCPRKGRKKRK